MITFLGKKYELLFSNQLPPLVALNYADELFFKYFEKLCGSRYRILSIIKNGWQNKYALIDDLEKLKKIFFKMIDKPEWIKLILADYDKSAHIFRQTLKKWENGVGDKISNKKIVVILKTIRYQAAKLDAMSNMLHLFSVMAGPVFLQSLKTYSNDINTINDSFVFYTQPVRESRFAKVILPELNDGIKLSRHDSNFSLILKAGTFIKDDVSELLDIRNSCLKYIFNILADRLGCKQTDLLYLNIFDIENYLFKNDESIKFLTKSRKSLTVLFYKSKKLDIYEGIKAQRFLSGGDFKEVTFSHKGREFIGESASFGKAKGRAVVATNSAEALVNMRAGDILVAPYTAVEYLPAMKKASAIVTETGGITAHAAIVARELKVPCLIGVKYITKIIKTGQIIEVDANNGIVKLCKN